MATCLKLRHEKANKKARDISVFATLPSYSGYVGSINNAWDPSWVFMLRHCVNAGGEFFVLRARRHRIASLDWCRPFTFGSWPLRRKQDSIMKSGDILAAWRTRIYFVWIVLLPPRSTSGHTVTYRFNTSTRQIIQIIRCRPSIMTHTG